MLLPSSQRTLIPSALKTGIMEKNMETTIMGEIGIIGYIYWGLYWDNGKENGNYYKGLYRV